MSMNKLLFPNIRTSYLCGLLCILLLAAPAAQAQIGFGDAAAENNDQFGHAVARGDFNGDGYQDLAVGVPYEDYTNEFGPGIPTTITDSGAVNVFYGTASGLTSANGQFLTEGGSGIAEDIIEANDLFGYSLAAGDFNHDGYDDLAIGIPGETFGCSLGCSSYAPNAGAVKVIYGSAAGLSTTTIPAQFWNQDSPDVKDAAGPYNSFGQSLAVGDFNRDGYADLAVGVPGETVPCAGRACLVLGRTTISQAGAVNVIYGSASGLSATAAHDNQFWHQNVVGVEDDAETNDHFGRSLAAGDFNGDGFADLAIGVEEGFPGAEFSGAVNVIYGSHGGLSVVYIPDLLLFSSNPLGRKPYELFGWSLAAGDFNGDGSDDLAVGVPNEAVCQVTACFTSGVPPVGEAGAVQVFYGTVPGLGRPPFNDQFLHLGASVALQDHFGWSLAAGDFDGDRKADLAVGAYRRDTGQAFGGVVDAGAVFTYRGSSSGLAPNGGFTQYGAVKDEPGAYDFFGWSLAAGDFNGDHRDDLAIGVLLEDLNSVDGLITDAGAVNVIYGTFDGLSTGPVPDQFWTQIYILSPLP